MKALTGLVIAVFALTALSAATPALADGHGNKLMKSIEMEVKNKKHASVITKRRMAMRALGGNMKKIGGYLKANKGGPADVAKAAANIAQIAKATPGLFPAGTGMARYPGVTGAKPAIFENNAGFKKAAMRLASLANGLAKASSAPGAGKAQIGKAFGPVGKMGCGGCHKNYRQKLKKK
jgi:cytochrome c556